MASDAMSQGWVILTTRYGTDVRSPTESQFIAALRELFDPRVDDEEHGDAWLRYGNDDGPMFVLTFTCGHTARFEEWADQDFEVELAPPRESAPISDSEALNLWMRLSAGDLQAVRDWRWGEAPAP